MVRLAIVRGLTYTDMAQVRSRWLVPIYACAYRWTGNRTDAEDLTAWIFHNISGAFGTSEPVRAVEDRLAELASEAIARHWRDRYGVASPNLSAFRPIGSRPTLEFLMTDLTAEMHLMLVLRFVRRRPSAAIANQLRVSVQEANRRTFVALAEVAERIALPGVPGIPQNLDDVSGFIADLLARRRPARFEAGPGTWPVMVAACQVQGAIAGHDLPTQRFVRSLESSKSRFVTELRIWSA